MIAVLVVEEAHTRRTTEQVAAWYTEVELQPGEYEIIAPGPLDYFRAAKVDGVITDEHFPSMFGGVAYTAGRKDNIGKPTTYWLSLPDKCDDEASEYGRKGRERFNEFNAGKAHIEMRTYEPAPQVTVKIENAYSDEHTSTREVSLPAPPRHAVYPEDVLDKWFEDVVYPETGDGHGIDSDLGSCYTATIIAAEDTLLVGLSREWID